MNKKKKFKRNFSEKISKDLERSGTSSYGYLKIPSGIKLFQPEIDSTVIMDFMPYEVTSDKHPDRESGVEKGDFWYKLPYKVHRNIGANGDSFICPASFGDRCPICERRAKLRKTNPDRIEDAKALEAEIEALRPTQRVLYCVRVYSKKKSKKPVFMLFEYSHNLFQKVFEDQLGKKKEFKTFPDPEEGTAIEVTFGEGKFAGVKFAEATRFDWYERPEQYELDVLDEIPELDKLLKVLDYETLRAKFYEIEEDEDEEYDDVEEEEEEDDIDDEDEEEEEEEEKPRKKKRSVKTSKTSKKKKKFYEDEDEDEDEDDEDEDEDDDADLEGDEDEGEEEEEKPKKVTKKSRKFRKRK